MYNHDEYDDFDELLPGAKKDRRKEILDQLQEIDADDFVEKDDSSYLTEHEPSISQSFLPSSMTKKKKKKHTFDVPEQTEDEWFQDLMSANDIKIKRSKRKDIFADSIDEATGKKKKKKKKEKNELTDYKKEFEPEAALLRNLLVDQNKFVESLQREYDYLKSSKSSSRGMTKNMTDLIANITSARNLSMQLVDKHTALKKTIADLSMKEKKEMSGSLEGMENLSDFASSYLKQMISERQQLMSGTNADISDYSTDEMASMIGENLLSGDDVEEREPEIDKYLEYENRNVKIYVYMNPDDETDYDYAAIDEDGEEIEDYPLPFKGKLSVNRSTNIATDTYGQKYEVRWR